MVVSPPSVEVIALARYVNEASGIELDESKAYLFETRLGKLLERTGSKSWSGLLELARRDTTGRLKVSIIDAVSTNETSFFREPPQFNLLAHELLPRHFERRDPKRLRVWCAAASTGQEVYSVAILLKEILGSLHKYEISLFGTDISESVLERASLGRYSALEISRGLSPERLSRNFVQRPDGYQICDELRALASYKRTNLLEDDPTIGIFDVILCRNDAIYFSPTNRTRLFSNLARHLRTGGILIISMTETLGQNTAPYVRKEFRGLTYYELPQR
jgi:chemotaxis protein methyltransferase CheR